MKKLYIPIVALSFFMAVTPVFAAGPYGFTFGDILKFFGLQTPNTTSFPVANPTLPVFPTQVQRPAVAPVIFPGNPTDTVTDSKVNVRPQNGTPYINSDGVHWISGRPTPTRGADLQNETPKPTPKADRSSELRALVTRMIDSYQNRIDNYTRFIEKVKTRREKLFTDGKDVSKLDAFISTAQTNLVAAQTALNTAKNTLSSLDYTDRPGTIIRNVRDQLKLVRQAMTTLHKSMSETVSEILHLSASTAETITPIPTRPKIKLSPVPPIREIQNGKINNPGQGGAK